MKLRYGFVSNSSSSSFVIDKEGLTKEQIRKIERWIEDAMGYSEGEHENYAEENSMSSSPKHFFGRVSYHVGFFDFLNGIGVPRKNIDESD